jgi:anti-sigma factor RsiW
MSCQELVELVTNYLEGLLPEDERARFEAHLAGCEGCTNYVQQMKQTLNIVGKLTEDHVPLAGKDELLNVFRQWKQGR